MNIIETKLNTPHPPVTRRRGRGRAALLAGIASIGIGSLALAAGKPLLSLRAFAVDMGSPGPVRSGHIDIRIERWSTDAERERLRDALQEKGSDALLSALQGIKPRVGSISASNSLGWDIRYAREEVGEDGVRRIVIATDRPMSYWEMTNRPRSSDYEFTLGEIRLSAEGKGEGKLVTAAKVAWNAETRTIEIENYAREPVRLNAVVGERPKR